MRYGYKDLLTLLISLFILGGCTNPTGIGLDVDVEDQIDAKFTDTISVRTYTVRDDSVQSAGFNQTVFGLINHPVIGQTDVGLALDIGASASLKKMQPETVIDSVILVLPYGSNFYGDTTLASSYTLQVRQLDEAFTINNYSTKKWAVKNPVVGTKTLQRFANKQTDSLTVTKHINGKDSVVKVIPQLRIALSKEFFKDLLSSGDIDSLTLVSGSSFRNLIKGLYLSVDSNLSTGTGGLLSFGPVEGVSGVEITYRQRKTQVVDDTSLDTVRAFLPIATAGNSGGFMGMTSSVEHHYSAEIEAALSGNGLSPEQLYLHAPVGLRGKVMFPEIDQLKDKGLVINKAELVLLVDQDAMAGPFTQPAHRLTMYRQDIAGRRQNIPDGSAISPSNGMPVDARSQNYFNFGGWYQSTPKRYVFHVTSYIQDVLLGKINGNELYIAPVATSDSYVPLNPAVNAGGSVVLGGHDNVKYKMHLNLYYTEAQSN